MKRPAARGVILYGSVVAIGLPIGFFSRAPTSADWALPFSEGASKIETTAALGPLAAEPFEPAPADADGAESSELRALLVTERRILPVPSLLPSPAACQNGGASCDEPVGNDWIAGLRMPDVPVHADATVAHYVHYFTEDAEGRRIFRAWLKRSGRYRGAVEAALRARGMPHDLTAVVFNESGFSPTAVSSAGAAGLWQLMPETARAYGLAVESDYDERRSVVRSSEVAVKHLSDLYEKFGTWDLALAAYDVGYKGMLDRVRDTGSNDYWTLCKMSGGLPHETSRYVPKVLAIAIIMNNLDRFSLADEHVDAPLDTADLEVPAGASIPLVARAAGTSVQHLRELNPEMLSDVVPSRGRDFVMHIPAAGLARARGILRRLLDRHERDGLELEVSRLFDWGKDELPAGAKGGEADPSGPADHILYRVGDHETLEEVSRTFGSSPAEIVETNHLDADAKLLRGMLLSVRVRDDVMARIGRKRAAARLNFTDVAPSAAAGSSGTKGSASLEHGTQGNAPLASASRDNDVSMGRQRTRKR